MPFTEKPFSPKYDSLKPSGAFGHAFGIFGTLMIIVGVGSYMLRKRTKLLFNLGFLKHWLEFHIFLCTIGPLFVLFHTEFKFGGIVAISFWSMTAVVLSGVVGRFIYIQIPRSIQGNELSMGEIAELNEGLTVRLRSEANLSPVIIGRIEAMIESEGSAVESGAMAISFLFKDYFSLRGRLTEIARELLTLGVPQDTIKRNVLPLLKAKLLLERKIRLLKTMQRFLHHWHIFHLPFAVIMFVIMIIHVVVTITFGYRWIF